MHANEYFCKEKTKKKTCSRFYFLSSDLFVTSRDHCQASSSTIKSLVPWACRRCVFMSSANEAELWSPARSSRRVFSDVQMCARLFSQPHTLASDWSGRLRCFACCLATPLAVGDWTWCGDDGEGGGGGGSVKQVRWMISLVVMSTSCLSAAVLIFALLLWVCVYSSRFEIHGDLIPSQF